MICGHLRGLIDQKLNIKKNNGRLGKVNFRSKKLSQRFSQLDKAEVGKTLSTQAALWQWQRQAAEKPQKNLENFCGN